MQNDMRSKFKVIDVKEFLENEPEEIPGKFFAYIQKSGYIALKHYTTKRRYEELRDAENPLFVPVFEARGAKDAQQKIHDVLERALYFSTHYKLKE